mmetsp:Transcript_45217/g.124224  ORF Transcript_45217/g.124224 Transcript_45217/m.124224 type:complete len:219 (-) Transcript_45217:1113-1769(-)
MQRGLRHANRPGLRKKTRGPPRPSRSQCWWAWQRPGHKCHPGVLAQGRSYCFAYCRWPARKRDEVPCLPALARGRDLEPEPGRIFLFLFSLRAANACRFALFSGRYGACKSERAPGNLKARSRRFSQLSPFVQDGPLHDHVRARGPLDPRGSCARTCGFPSPNTKGKQRPTRQLSPDVSPRHTSEPRKQLLPHQIQHQLVGKFYSCWSAPIPTPTCGQ